MTRSPKQGRVPLAFLFTVDRLAKKKCERKNKSWRFPVEFALLFNDSCDYVEKTVEASEIDCIKLFF